MNPSIQMHAVQAFLSLLILVRHDHGGNGRRHFHPASDPALFFLLSGIQTEDCHLLPKASTSFTTTQSNSDSRIIHYGQSGRRDLLLQSMVAASFLAPNYTARAWAYTPDSDKLRESLYLISRVQEATVQQERFVNTNRLQEVLRQKMKLTLRLVEKNYLLLDQINFASQYIEPADAIVEAVSAGNAAVDALQNAIDYVNNDLKIGPLTTEQSAYLTSNLQECREELFVFLRYMPKEKLDEARRRVEEENVKNREEFDSENLGSDAGLYNPVELPWKQQRPR